VTGAIVGVGEVEPAWQHDRPVLGLVVDATRRALADAGLTGADVDGIATEAETMHGARADEVGAAVGARDRRFSVQSSIAGAGVLAALQLAELAIEAGLADVVVSAAHQQAPVVDADAQRHRHPLIETGRRAWSMPGFTSHERWCGFWGSTGGASTGTRRGACS
jgi:3-oxoacyl-[acyl-carrier-protein] synthase III